MTDLREGHVAGRYLNINEAAAYLNVTVRFMRRLVADHHVQYYKVGKFLRFERRDLDSYVQGRVVRPVVDDISSRVWLGTRTLG